MREAEVSVTDTELTAMGVDELLALTREAGLLAVEELACHGNGAVLQVEVGTRIDEDRLATLDCVDEWNHVAERDDSRLYVVSFTAPDLPERLEETAADLVGTCDPEVEDRGATMSLVGPHEAISGQISGYEEAGVSPTLRRIDSYEGPEHPLDELTARQREVIETAWEMGYYEVPKEASGEDVAAEMGTRLLDGQRAPPAGRAQPARSVPLNPRFPTAAPDSLGTVVPGVSGKSGRPPGFPGIDFTARHLRTTDGLSSDGPSYSTTPIASRRHWGEEGADLCGSRRKSERRRARLSRANRRPGPCACSRTRRYRSRPPSPTSRQRRCREADSRAGVRSRRRRS